MSNHRLVRIAHLIKNNLAMIIQREMGDPRLAKVSITDVEVARDLAHAKVFVSPFDPLNNDIVDIKEMVTTLNNASGSLRRHLSQNINNLRTTPQLKFVHDDSSIRASRIDQLLQSS